MPNGGVVQMCAGHSDDGELCRQPAMANGLCRKHFGKNGSGIAAPRFKTGRFGRVLPLRLVADYQERLNDPELISQRDNLALLETRMIEVFEGLDHGESGELWAALGKAGNVVRRLERAANAEKDTEKRKELAKDRECAIESLILFSEQGLADRAAWSELRDLMQEHRKLAAADAATAKQRNGTMTAERALLFVGEILNIVKQHVRDRAVLANIQRSIDQLLAPEGAAG